MYVCVCVFLFFSSTLISLPQKDARFHTLRVECIASVWVLVVLCRRYCAKNPFRKLFPWQLFCICAQNGIAYNQTKATWKWYEIYQEREKKKIERIINVCVMFSFLSINAVQCTMIWLLILSMFLYDFSLNFERSYTREKIYSQYENIIWVFFWLFW